jgi:hypothetical protein
MLRIIEKAWRNGLLFKREQAQSEKGKTVSSEEK